MGMMVALQGQALSPTGSWQRRKAWPLRGVPAFHNAQAHRIWNCDLLIQVTKATWPRCCEKTRMSRMGLSAASHQQRDQGIARLVKKWEEQGYTVRILAVRKRLPGPQQN